MKVNELLLKYSYKDRIYINARDIRNTVSHIANQYEKELSWHERKPSNVIYAKPTGNAIKIYFINRPDIADYVFNTLADYKAIRIPNKKYIFVKGVKIQETEWCVEKLSGYKNIYKTRENIVIAVNSPEWNISCGIKHKGDLNEMSAYLGNIIKRTVKYNFNIWGENVDVEDIKTDIIPTNSKQIIDSSYKKDVKLPIWRGMFVSNYELPPFVGYKTGLGLGELLKLTKI